MSSAQIKELALALSPEDRAELAEALWASVENASFPLSEEFLAELEQRDASISRGEVSIRTHDEVMEKIRRELGR
jgi:putative addiction module component (TIGR02574 family)